MTRRNLLAAGIAGMTAPAVFPVQASAAAPRLSTALFGQSNASRWFDAGCTARDAFAARVVSFGDPRVPAFANLAVGGTAMLEDFAPVNLPNYHWVTRAGAAGPMLTRAVTLLGRMAEKPTALLMVQGETDGFTYAGSTAGDDAALFGRYTAAAGFVVARLRAEIGADVPVFVQTLGPRRLPTPTMAPRRGYPIIRAAHYALATQPGWFLAGTPGLDTPLVDTVHYSDAGLRWCAERAADAMRGRI